MNHEDYDIGSQLAAVSRYPIEPHRVYSNLSMDQSLPSAPRPTSVRHLALPRFWPGRPGWIISSGTGAAAQRKRILDWLDAFADDHSAFVPPHAILLCPVAASAHGRPLPDHDLLSAMNKGRYCPCCCGRQLVDARQSGVRFFCLGLLTPHA
jgi:hypothetical protein